MPRKINALFKTTEPTAEAAADLSPVAPLEAAADSAPKARKPQRIKPQSVYLNESDLKYIQAIAEEYNETKHAVLQYAVKELIRKWKRGGKLKTNNIGKLDR